MATPLEIYLDQILEMAGMQSGIVNAESTDASAWATVCASQSHVLNVVWHLGASHSQDNLVVHFLYKKRQ